MTDEAPGQQDVSDREIEQGVDAMSLRAQVQKRHIIVNRTSNFEMMAASKQTTVVRGMLTQSMCMDSDPDLTIIRADDIKESRDTEKKDLQDLNERLADYIESSRFYRIQSHKLAVELERLRKIKLGNESSRTKALYETEMKEARRLLMEAVEERGHLVIELDNKQETIKEMRYRLELALNDAADTKGKFKLLNQQLAHYEGEISLLRRQLESLESEGNRERDLIQTLKDKLKRVRQDCNSETLLHINAENKRQSLEEELIFIKTIHEQELKEREALIFRDSTVDNHAFWKLEIGQALRDIQQVNDERLETIRRDAEATYKVKLEEIRLRATKNSMQWSHFKEENARLREQNQILIDRCEEAVNKHTLSKRDQERLKQEFEASEREWEKSRSEMEKRVVMLFAEREATLREINVIRDTKNGLESSIVVYRRLLDLEENRIEPKPSIVFEYGENGATSTDDSLNWNLAMSTKTTHQNKHKGHVQFADFSEEEGFITLENTGREDEVLGFWSLIRTTDGMDDATHTFHASTVLPPGQKIKVWSKGSRPDFGADDDVEFDQKWGIGSLIHTKLINPAGEERAYCIHEQISDGNSGL